VVERKNLLNGDLATRRFVEGSSDCTISSFTDSMEELVVIPNLELGERLVFLGAAHGGGNKVRSGERPRALNSERLHIQLAISNLGVSKGTAWDSDCQITSLLFLCSAPI
jgi:hypothetical protein